MFRTFLVSIITFSTMSLHGMENGTVSVEDAKIFASYRSGNSFPLGKALHGAILSNDFPRFKYLLTPVDNINHSRLGLLWLLCGLDQLDFITFLVEKKGAQLTSNDIRACLDVGWESASAESLEYWIDHVGGIEGTDINTLLIKVCSKHDGLNLVKKLLQKGADINHGYYDVVVNFESKTPFGIAIRSNNPCLMKYLLSQGVRINPLYVACAAGNKDMSFFVEQYANIRDGGDRTVLHYGGVITKRLDTLFFPQIVGGNKNKIHHLLMSGTNPEIKDLDGHTAYDVAINKEEKEMLKNKDSARKNVIIPYIQEQIHHDYAGSFALTRALRNREYDGRFTKRIAY